MAIENKPFKAPNGLEVGGTDGIILPQGTTAERPTGFTGTYIRYNTTTDKTEIGVDGVWAEIGGGGIQWSQTLVTGNVNALNDGGHLIDSRAGEVRVQLPSSPSGSTELAFLDLYGTFNTNNLVIEPASGTRIMGLEEPLVVNTANQSLTLTYSGHSTPGWRITSVITTAEEPEPKSTHNEFEQLFTNGGLSVWSRGNTVNRQAFNTFTSRNYGPDQVLIGGSGDNAVDIVVQNQSMVYDGKRINSMLITGDHSGQSFLTFGRFVTKTLGSTTVTYSVIIENQGADDVIPRLHVSLVDNSRSIIVDGIVNNVTMDTAPGTATTRISYTFTMPAYTSNVHQQNAYFELIIPGRNFNNSPIRIAGFNLTPSDRLLDLIVPDPNQDSEDCILFKQSRQIFRGSSSYNINGIQRHYAVSYGPKFKFPTVETTEPNPPTASVNGTPAGGFTVSYDSATSSTSTNQVVTLIAEI